MALHQSFTYTGLLQGIPTTDTNNRFITWHLQAAQKYCPRDTAPVLVAPPRRDYQYQLGDMAFWQRGANMKLAAE